MIRLAIQAFVRWLAVMLMTFVALIAAGYALLLAWDHSHPPKLPPEVRLDGTDRERGHVARGGRGLARMRALESRSIR